MQNKHMIAPVMETKTMIGGTQSSLVQTTYFSPFANIYVPQEVKVQNGANPIETRQTFTKYDSRGTLLEQQKPGDVKENYLWGYYSHFLLAKITGSDYAAINAANSQGILDNAEMSEGAVPATLKLVRNALTGSNPSAQMTSYTYASLMGINTVTDPNGRTIHYQYDSFGRLMSINNANGAVPGTIRAGYCYNYAGQPVDCPTLASTGSMVAPSLTLIAEGGALPVTLIDFEAFKVENTVNLKWSTTSETNSDRFEIERSNDGKQWIKIGSLPAFGESNARREYSFTDAHPDRDNPANKESFYRLKMIDRDETFAYSRIRSVVFDRTSEMVLYPNPITIGDKLNVITEDITRMSKVQIFDSGGKLVLQSASARSIDVRGLAAGSYVVQITYTDGSLSSHRVIKQ
jgi:YD repeat-containing protein